MKQLKDGHRVCQSLIADDTASIRLALWDDNIDALKEGDIVKINKAYWYVRLCICVLSVCVLLQQLVNSCVNICVGMYMYM